MKRNSQFGLPRDRDMGHAIRVCGLHEIKGEPARAIMQRLGVQHLTTKAGVSGHTSTTGESGAALLAQDALLVAQYTVSLNQQTLFGLLRPWPVIVPFEMPLRGFVAEPTAATVARGAAIPVSQATFQQAPLARANRAVILVASQELLEFPGAADILAASTQRALAREINAAALDPTRTASLTNGAVEVPSGGSAYSDVDFDVQDTLEAASNANDVSLYWALAPAVIRALAGLRTAFGNLAYPNLSIRDGGELHGIPVVVCPGAPTDTLTLFDASEVLLASDTARVRVSQDASFEMDTAPNQDIETPTASNVLSLFQAESVAIGVSQDVNFRMRRPNCVAFISNFSPRSGITTA